MFGKILYISDNKALLENKGNEFINGDLLNVHLVFESNNTKILGEIVEVRDKEIEVKLLGEFENNKYKSGLLRKLSFNSTIRVINKGELLELIGREGIDSFELGASATYKAFKVYPKINDFFSSHACIFGNSGSGKSCGVARIIQNVLSNNLSSGYNANFIFFDSFGEYKNAFKDLNNVNSKYNYSYLALSNNKISIPNNLLTVDDLAILLGADKHTQLTIIERALKYAKIFRLETPEAIKTKNNIIAKALIAVLYSTSSTKQKKDEIFSIIDACHTNEFNFDSIIPGVGYTRSFSECFMIDSKGRFGEEVLITEYILKFASEEVCEDFDLNGITYTLEDLAKALDFTLISEGFNQNKNMHDDAQLLKVRLHNLINSKVGSIFNGSKALNAGEYLTSLFVEDNKKSQIVNISLEGIDDIEAKSIVKIIARILFEFCKNKAISGVIPFHLFLEEAHRYIQNDNDVFLLGYNVFDRIAKEGRKYGIILDIISQRPVEVSETVISQCSNFLIFKMTHPKDIKYIEEMLPNISSDVIDKMKVLQPGTCVAFGSAFKMPMIVKLDMPSPTPYSASCDISSYWNK